MAFLLKQVVPSSAKLICITQQSLLKFSNSCMHIQLQENLFTETRSLLNHEINIMRQLHRRKQIRGGGRPVPEGYIKPEPMKYGWRPIYPEDGKYTTKPLPILKLGGRDPVTRRVVVRTIGGGQKKMFRWVDTKRVGPKDGSTLVEKVFEVRSDQCRSAHIALVASGDHKRWILATEHMKVGDLIETCGVIPHNPVLPKEGNAHPIGALPIGTLVHSIEKSPGEGGKFCQAAGTAAQLIKKFDNKCMILLPSKLQVLLDEKCMAVCGRVSNIDHGSKHIGSPNQLRWLGYRPRSGFKHKKDGYCGRKIHPPKPIKDLLAEREEKPEIYELTWCDEKR